MSQPNIKINKVSKAKANLALDYPFWGSLLMRKPSIEKQGSVPFQLVGDEVHYSQEAMEQHSVSETIGILAKMASHIAFLHHTRIHNRNEDIWNAATSYVVNPILKQNGFKLPPDALFDPRFDPQKQNAEDVYKILEEEVKQGQTGINSPQGDSGEGEGQSGGGNGESDDEEDESNGEGSQNQKQQSKGKASNPNAPHQINLPSWGNIKKSDASENKSHRERMEAETKVDVLQAATTAKNRGKLPAAFASLIEEFKKPKVNWKEKLRTFIGGNNPDDWSYRRTNRKLMATIGGAFPTIEYRGAGTVVIGVDSSGSVGQAEMAQFFGEMKAIHQEMMPEIVYVIWCDAEIQKVQTFTPIDDLDSRDSGFGKRYGGGGTTLHHVFDYVEEHQIVPDSFVFLTDLEVYMGEFSTEPPTYPVLWVTTSSEQAPWGEVVKIEVD